jgi:hypothetical protein
VQRERPGSDSPSRSLYEGDHSSADIPLGQIPGRRDVALVTQTQLIL